jgi:hypothetical protein
MGSLLFALDLLDILDEVVRRFPTIKILAFLDDMYLQGPRTGTQRAYEYLPDCFQSIKVQNAPQV